MNNPRSEIEHMTASGDLKGLLKKTGELHGHYCSYSALGVKAGYRAVKDLNVVGVMGMEHVLAIVETNNCFSDGVQVVTGCSFGNNALIYRDYGRTAVTLLKRDGRGVRIAVRPDANEVLNERYPEVRQLFRKVVAERRGNREDERRLMELSKQASFDLLSVPDEKLFTIEKVVMKVPAEYSRILESVKCSKCGENVMKTRIATKDGEPLCIPCSGRGYYQMDWSGISVKEDEMKISSIGYVKNRFDEPTEKMREGESRIILDPKYAEGLYRIEEHEYLDVIYYFHKSAGYKLKVKTPRWGVRGVFASRSPGRPSPLGLTTVKLLRVEENQLLVKGLDALNGTPVLDIKPHIGGF